MILFLSFRYLDRADKQFKDRDLFLNTKSLDPVLRAAVELLAENNSPKSQREILKYRHLFSTVSPPRPTNHTEPEKYMSVGPTEYYEDETGKEISGDELAQILTGNPTARIIPPGAAQHDIDFMFSEPKPLPLDQVSLTVEEVQLLGYFVRDLQELKKSIFMKEGAGSLKSIGIPRLTVDSELTLETAVTDDEIRSFVTIFRRLYMTGHHDPASLDKIVPMFTKALGDHPYSKWVDGAFKHFQLHLESVPETPFIPNGTCTFTTKRLIDVFLYTQYAHQPDAKRERQFKKCLDELYGKRAVLTWMFLAELWRLSFEIVAIGKVIAWWFKQYCDHHKVELNVLDSLRVYHEGLGAVEKKKDRAARLLQEKVDQLATELWEQAGRPAVGRSQYVEIARHQLSQILDKYPAISNANPVDSRVERSEN